MDSPRFRSHYDVVLGYHTWSIVGNVILQMQMDPSEIPQLQDVDAANNMYQNFESIIMKRVILQISFTL